ncbi:MAG: amino acid ABC transporter permease [Alphaproteobacteria bacterium]|nr:amino acid ABC transporter permease [Alphaproteobacteria bacterium]
MKRRSDAFSSLAGDPRIRGIIAQVILLAVLAGVFGWLISNAADALSRQGKVFGFEFLNDTAGFGIIQTLVPYTERSSYGRALLVGLLNTLLVAALGIIIATVLGFLIGIGRLSQNWLIRQIATVYVETLRNLPLLLQIVFWYFAVIGSLPGPKQGYSLFGTFFLNNRGVFLPSLVLEPGSGVLAISLVLGVVLAGVIFFVARVQRLREGRSFAALPAAILALIGLPLAALIATDFPVSLSWPALKGFNFQGGVQLLPELFALLVALSTYTASYIAEIVRAGIEGVPRGQSEAALSLGLTRAQALRFVIVPQAMRIIVPPLASQYLNLTKNSSLAVAIAYPDLVSVFAGTALNQTGKAIEIILMTMLVYLSISLFTAFAMNIYNARIKLTER